MQETFPTSYIFIFFLLYLVTWPTDFMCMLYVPSPCLEITTKQMIFQNKRKIYNASTSDTIAICLLCAFAIVQSEIHQMQFVDKVEKETKV